jgi:hypothetical protein
MSGSVRVCVPTANVVQVHIEIGSLSDVSGIEKESVIDHSLLAAASSSHSTSYGDNADCPEIFADQKTLSSVSD